MEKIVGFFAYPSMPRNVRECLKEAVKSANSHGGCNITSWEENDVAGRPLTAPIFSGLEAANMLLADITTLNFNVTFEIGYAIGIGKRVFLTKSREYDSDTDLINRVGIFDTLGYVEYKNSSDLAHILDSITDLHPIDTTAKPNATTPAYVVETPIRGQIMSEITSRVKKARLFYRSFVPAETVRMSAPDVIYNVASSYGVIVPLLGPNLSDAKVHNTRAAFVIGLSLGMEVPVLVLQDHDGPLAPLDVRDYVNTYSSAEDVKRLIHEFSLTVFERLQEAKPIKLPDGNVLSKITVGDPMAENEFQNLARVS